MRLAPSQSARPGYLRAAFVALADFVPTRRASAAGTAEHLRETIAWLYRAQDATPDGGVSRGYSLTTGWGASYPETTGYIIPTLFDYARLSGDGEAAERARRMADWELAIQLPSGAIQAGLIDAPPVPTIFNTGQVIFGWARAYRESGDVRYRRACARAADWLAAAQDADGEWRAERSPLVRSGAVNTYNTRTAWALVEAYGITGDEAHRAAAVANLDRALAKQQANGWFPDACLNDNARPLLHTIAYTIEGLLEAGLLLGRADYVGAAAIATRALIARMRRDHGLAGRFDAAWRPAARWACVTGVAQMALVCLRLFEVTGVEEYGIAGRRLNRFLESTQDIRTADPGVRGGMKGSHPHTGGYCPFDYLNWAAKFFADALMLELRFALPAPGRERACARQLDPRLEATGRTLRV